MKMDEREGRRVGQSARVISTVRVGIRMWVQASVMAEIKLITDKSPNT